MIVWEKEPKKGLSVAFLTQIIESFLSAVFGLKKKKAPFSAWQSLQESTKSVHPSVHYISVFLSYCGLCFPAQ